MASLDQSHLLVLKCGDLDRTRQATEGSIAPAGIEIWTGIVLAPGEYEDQSHLLVLKFVDLGDFGVMAAEDQSHLLVLKWWPVSTSRTTMSGINRTCWY